MPPRSNARRAPQAVPPNVFDLDALERDGAPGPLHVTLAGQVFEFSDPKDWDWHDAERITTGEQGLLGMLGEEQFAEFTKLPLPQWKIDALGKKIQEHFGAGEDAASPS